MGPLYPDAPNAPGVPPVLRDQNNKAPSNQPQQLADSPDIATQAARQWGIFGAKGGAVVEADNVASFDHAIEYRVPDYPLAGGKFESYNKVATPYEIHVSLSKGGPLAERQAFLKTIEALVPSLDLYSVVTPEQTYLNANIISSRLARTGTNGAGMLTVEIGLIQVRQSATQKFTNSKAASGADVQDGGGVQAKATDNKL